jgi:hypothetical protein
MIKAINEVRVFPRRLLEPRSCEMWPRFSFFYKNEHSLRRRSVMITSFTAVTRVRIRLGSLT